MRRFPAILFLLGTLACFAAEPAFQICTVADVHDGDTLTVHCAGETARLRVSSIDAPELRQSHGMQASIFASRLASFGVQIRVQPLELDKYGRTVARIQLSDGRDFAREMVRTGMAWHYVKYSRDPELADLEAEARTGRTGLWAASDPETPAAYRNRQRQAERSQRGYARRSEPRSQKRSLVSRR